MELKDKKCLLIDDMAAVRSSLKVQLAQIGLEQCEMAKSASDAIDLLKLTSFDVVICDFNLGGGSSGQQLLEFAKSEHLLSHSAVFIMMTGESQYETVALSAELAPDEYLLKPFRSEMLLLRLIRAMERKHALKSILTPLDERNKEAALAAAEVLGLEPEFRYHRDVDRYRGELLYQLGRFDEAIAHFDQVLATRPLPWAQVGKGRCFLGKHDEDSAAACFSASISEFPSYVAAHDEMTALLQKLDTAAAQQMVERAMAVIPSSRRQRHFGQLALANEDYVAAESAFRRAIEQERSGFFKEVDDYDNLMRCRLKQGKHKDALHALRLMAEDFVAVPETKGIRSALESIVHAAANNQRDAQRFLDQALEIHASNSFQPNAALLVAEACFVNKKASLAYDIVQSVVSNHGEHEEVIARAKSVFTKVNKADEGEAFLTNVQRQIAELNNEAVTMAQAGDVEQAVEILTEAANRLSGNFQVSLNAALVLLMYAKKHGMNQDLSERVQTYLAQAKRCNAEHPKIASVEMMYTRMTANKLAEH